MISGTQDFPYTLRYVRDLLGLDLDKLTFMMRELGIVPERDPETRQQVLTLREISLIKRALKLEKEFEAAETRAEVSMSARERVSVSSETPVTVEPPQRSVSRSQTSEQTSVTQQAPQPAMSDRQLNALMNSVANLKGTMVDEMAHMLDSKLSGLDSIVMELIRVKSENEILKREIEALEYDNYELRGELASFCEMPLGLYRKER